jgi:hypothetical protein
MGVGEGKGSGMRTGPIGSRFSAVPNGPFRAYSGRELTQGKPRLCFLGPSVVVRIGDGSDVEGGVELGTDRRFELGTDRRGKKWAGTGQMWQGEGELGTDQKVRIGDGSNVEAARARERLSGWRN